MSEPMLIQGGMGVAVSNWRLAREVSLAGQLGVVSGTLIDVVMCRRLQDGDPGGHVVRALEAFPDRVIADDIINRYYIRGGKPKEAPYKVLPMHAMVPNRSLDEITVAANFVEVFLAKEGHDGLVGINYLEKIQLPTLPSLFGAMLAGVDYVLMGAGIPRAIPGILASLSSWQEARLRIAVTDATADDDFSVSFNPSDFFRAPDLESRRLPLKTPKFLAVISSVALAKTLTRKGSSQGAVHGFVIEGHSAGGHNAPPRGPLRLDEQGQPVYSEKDRVNLAEIRAIGLPFWLAGSFGSREMLDLALSEGAQGVQVGTPFAFCRESGFEESIKRKVIDLVKSGQAKIETDCRASSSGFPFKILDLDGSLSREEEYINRQRVCDLGFLREAYKREDGTAGFRCPGEPEALYEIKGGDPADTPGRKCLCNALLASAGLPQVQTNGDRHYIEMPLITAGESINEIAQFIEPGRDDYSARTVVEMIVNTD
ncbi:MAG: nitronate monooxygenase [Candidatus Melainabacteria bacterium]|nr:nitronate monooxygenase [Candidatus Melainabacteria bacterium]